MPFHSSNTGDFSGLKAAAPSRETTKAVVAAVVALAAYLTGVLSADQGLGDVTVVQWLGAVVFLGSSYGLTYRATNATRIR